MNKLALWLNSLSPRTHNLIGYTFIFAVIGEFYLIFQHPLQIKFCIVLLSLTLIPMMFYLALTEEAYREVDKDPTTNQNDLDKPTFMRQRQTANSDMIHDDVPDHPLGDEYLEVPAFLRRGQRPLPDENYEEFPRIQKGGLFLIINK